jgi:hypothetical protein
MLHLRKNGSSREVVFRTTVSKTTGSQLILSSFASLRDLNEEGGVSLFEDEMALSERCPPGETPDFPFLC